MNGEKHQFILRMRLHSTKDTTKLRTLILLLTVKVGVNIKRNGIDINELLKALVSYKLTDNFSGSVEILILKTNITVAYL
jgi:hypothetical protein